MRSNVYVFFYALTLCLGENQPKFAKESSQNAEELFVPTHEWQTIKEGQKIPRGLHYRINFETHVKEAKLIEVNRKVVVQDQEVNGVGAQNLKTAPNLNFEELEQARKNLKNADVSKPLKEDNKFRGYAELKKDLSDLNLAAETDAENRPKSARESYKDDEDLFVPTHEWQTVWWGQRIPEGLRVRFNFETHVREAKLMDEEFKQAIKNMKNDDVSKPLKFSSYAERMKDLCDFNLAAKTEAHYRPKSAKESSQDGEDLFMPTHEWQTIKRGQKIPRGLYVRANFQTRIRETKVIVKNVNENTKAVAQAQEVNDVGAPNLNFEELEHSRKNLKNGDVPKPFKKDNKLRSYAELDKDLQDLFMPTHEWRTISRKPGQKIPDALHIRENFETHVIEGKLMDEKTAQAEHASYIAARKPTLAPIPKFSELGQTRKNLKNDDVSKPLKEDNKFRSYTESKKDIGDLNLAAKTDPPKNPFEDAVEFVPTHEWQSKKKGQKMTEDLYRRLDIRFNFEARIVEYKLPDEKVNENTKSAAQVQEVNGVGAQNLKTAPNLNFEELEQARKNLKKDDVSKPPKEDNKYETYADVKKQYLADFFVPTHEWQAKKEWQHLPEGLLVRLNPETGVREYKLPDKKVNAVAQVQEVNGASAPNLKTPPNLNAEELEQALKNLKNDDVSKPPKEDKKFRSYAELKKDLGDLNLAAKTDAEILKELLGKHKKVLSESNPNGISQILLILKDLEYLVHQYDNAIDFMNLQGFEEVILKNLNSTNPEIKRETLILLGSSLQNNAKVQIHVLENGSVGILLRILALDSDFVVKTRAVFALGGLLRRFPLAQLKFVENAGLTVFAKLLEKSHFKIQVKILTLIDDLILEQKYAAESDDLEKLAQYNQVNLKQRLKEHYWCGNLNTLLLDIFRADSNDNDAIEKCLIAILNVLDTCDVSNIRSLKLVIKKMQEYYDKSNVVQNKDIIDLGYYSQLSNLCRQISAYFSPELKTEL